MLLSSGGYEKAVTILHLSIPARILHLEKCPFFRLDLQSDEMIVVPCPSSLVADRGSKRRLTSTCFDRTYTTSSSSTFASP